MTVKEKTWECRLLHKMPASSGVKKETAAKKTVRLFAGEVRDQTLRHKLMCRTADAVARWCSKESHEHSAGSKRDPPGRIARMLIGAANADLTNVSRVWERDRNRSVPSCLATVAGAREDGIGAVDLRQIQYRRSALSIGS